MHTFSTKGVWPKGEVGITSIWDKFGLYDIDEVGELLLWGLIHWSQSCVILDIAVLRRAGYHKTGENESRPLIPEGNVIFVILITNLSKKREKALVEIKKLLFLTRVSELIFSIFGIIVKYIQGLTYQFQCHEPNINWHNLQYFLT